MTHHRHFKHIHVPEHWEQYWSKYPNGYSLLEALITWASQVNKMVDSYNKTSDHVTTIDRNVRALEKELRSAWEGYKEYVDSDNSAFKDEVHTIINNFIASVDPRIQDQVVDSLGGWLDDGTLADIINNDVFDMKANQSDLDETIQKIESTTINVKWFEGLKEPISQGFDWTNAINTAIEMVDGGTVIIPKSAEPYYINADKPQGTLLERIEAPGGIKLKSNVELKIEEGATLKAIPSSEQHYSIISINECRNVRIYGGGKLKGDRTEHIGEGGEWGHGIQIIGSSDVIIENIHAEDCWGDGFYIRKSSVTGISKNIRFLDCTSNNNRRQGLSITSGYDMFFTNCDFTNTNGTPPQAGVDVEPNNAGDHIKNIYFINCRFNGNRGRGLIFDIRNDGTCEDVRIIDCEAFDNGQDGLRMDSKDLSVLKHVEINSFKTDGMIRLGDIVGEYPDSVMEHINIIGQTVCSTLYVYELKHGVIDGLTLLEDGLNISGIEDYKIYNLVVEYSNDRGIYFRSLPSHNVTIYNPIIRNTTESGIEVANSDTSNVKIIGGEVSNSGKHGIWMRTVQGWMVTGVTVKDNAERGISLAGVAAVNNVLTSNTIINNEVDLYIEALDTTKNIVESNLTSN